jgi:hypothetical protein
MVGLQRFRNRDREQKNIVAFPLILTFSRREKEPPLASLIKLVTKLTASEFCLARRGERFPLSRRERAGVRGKNGIQNSSYSFSGNALIKKAKKI